MNSVKYRLIGLEEVTYMFYSSDWYSSISFKTNTDAATYVDGTQMKAYAFSLGGLNEDKLVQIDVSAEGDNRFITITDKKILSSKKKKLV